MVHAGNLRAHHRPRGLEEPDGHLLEGSPACLCAARSWVFDEVLQNNVYHALEIVLGCLALHGMHVVASKFQHALAASSHPKPSQPVCILSYEFSGRLI